MDRKPTGFDLEIIPINISATSPRHFELETLLAIFKESWEEPNKPLTDHDYHSHEKSYMLFFMSWFNFLSYQEEDTGIIFLEYQYQLYYSENQSGFIGLLKKLINTQQEFLEPEASECIERFLVRHEPSKRDVNTTELSKLYLLEQAFKKANSGKEFSKIEIIRLVLFVENNPMYTLNKTGMQSRARTAKNYFQESGKLSKEQKKRLDILLSNLDTEDYIEGYKK